MRDLCDAAAEHPEMVDPIQRHAVIKVRYFMKKSKHTALVTELVRELRKQPIQAWKGKKVVLTGIMAEPDGLLDLFKKYDLAIVADDLAQESRQFRHDVPSGRTPLLRLAKWWQELDGCSLAKDPKKPRGQMLIDLVNEHEGAIKKFRNAIEQVTFSGSYAVENRQPVLYITERAVFELREDGLHLTEVAPGIDIEWGILAQMDFAPIIDRARKLMDARIFEEAPMGLSSRPALLEVVKSPSKGRLVA